jgi:hypothetical protein
MMLSVSSLAAIVDLSSIGFQFDARSGSETAFGNPIDRLARHRRLLNYQIGRGYSLKTS